MRLDIFFFGSLLSVGPVCLSQPQKTAQSFPVYLTKDFDYATFTRFEAQAPLFFEVIVRLCGSGGRPLDKLGLTGRYLRLSEVPAVERSWPLAVSKRVLPNFSPPSSSCTLSDLTLIPFRVSWCEACDSPYQVGALAHRCSRRHIRIVEASSFTVFLHFVFSGTRFQQHMPVNVRPKVKHPKERNFSYEPYTRNDRCIPIHGSTRTAFAGTEITASHVYPRRLLRLPKR